MTHYIPDEDNHTGSHDTSPEFHSYKESYTTRTKTPQEALIAKLQTHLSSVEHKSGDKHLHKTNVLKEAIRVLKGKGDSNSLQKVIDANPKYNEALFSSKTESLVNDVKKMISSKQFRPGT
jgi:hypothetical protein